MAGTELVATPWTPGAALADEAGAVPPEFTCAALDCVQLWALIEIAPAGSKERVVTGAITARADAPLQAGTPYVVVGWPMHRNGRAIFAGGAILSAEGELMVAAMQRAVAVEGVGVPLGFGKMSA